MIHQLKSVWRGYVMPMLQRPERLQVAALCYRTRPQGREVLLITSRGTGRWILPKGWPINGKDGAESALQEAWEEAGVAEATAASEPLGSYHFIKNQDNGTAEPVMTLVYAAEVRRLADQYPESHERKRQWMPPAEAANLVHEPELRDLLRQL